MPRTGRPVAMLVPQSPRTKRPSQATYCAGSGRSRPSACRCAANCSSVAVGPTRSRAGSPGASRMRKNIRVTHADDHGKAGEGAAQQNVRACCMHPADWPNVDTVGVAGLEYAVLGAASSPSSSCARSLSLACGSSRAPGRYRAVCLRAPTSRASIRCSPCIRWPGRSSATCCSPPWRATTARLTPRPYLARSWSGTPDRRGLTLHLQTGSALARRSAHHRARCGLDPRRGARSRHRLSRQQRAGRPATPLSARRRLDAWCCVFASAQRRFPRSADRPRHSAGPSPRWACHRPICARPDGTARRLATGRSGSFPTSPTGAGCSPPTARFLPRWAAHRGWIASSW